MTPGRRQQAINQSPESRHLNELTSAIREDLSLEEKETDNLSASADLVIKKIEHHLTDLQKCIKMIAINADKLLTWGVNSQHDTGYS